MEYSVLLLEKGGTYGALQICAQCSPWVRTLDQTRDLERDTIQCQRDAEKDKNSASALSLWSSRSLTFRLRLHAVGRLSRICPPRVVFQKCQNAERMQLLACPRSPACVFSASFIVCYNQLYDRSRRSPLRLHVLRQLYYRADLRVCIIDYRLFFIFL